MKLEDLKQQHRVVEFELKSAIAQGNFVPMDKVKDLYGNIGKYIQNEMGRVPDVNELPVFNATNVMNSLSKTTYLDMSGTTIYMPRGCRVTLLTYARLLLDEMRLVAKYRETVFRPFEKWVNVCLGDPKKLSVISEIEMETYDAEKAAKRLKAFVGVGDSQTMGNYEKLMDRNKDWENVAVVNRELQRVMKEFPIEKVAEQLESIKATSILLVDLIEKNKEAYDLSKVTAENLSDKFHNCAAAFAHIGRMYALVIAFNEMLQSNEVRIKEIIR